MQDSYVEFLRLRRSDAVIRRAETGESSIPARSERLQRLADNARLGAEFFKIVRDAAVWGGAGSQAVSPTNGPGAAAFAQAWLASSALSWVLDEIAKDAAAEAKKAAETERQMRDYAARVEASLQKAQRELERNYREPREFLREYRDPPSREVLERIGSIA